MPPSLALLVAIAFVAAVYASVGQGGGTGFLAVLALFAAPVTTAASSALVLNVLVAGTAWWSFRRAGHFAWRPTWPFVAGSVPAALFAGALHAEADVVRGVLAVSLAGAAVLMFVRPRSGAADAADAASPRGARAVALGAAIGSVSGLVGVGGGVFLSPVLILRRWAAPQRVAATAACFVVVNSLAGLAGRALRGGLDLGDAPPLVAAAIAGALVGARLGAGRRGAAWQRALLGVVLAVAAARLGAETAAALR